MKIYKATFYCVSLRNLEQVAAINCEEQVALWVNMGNLVVNGNHHNPALHQRPQYRYHVFTTIICVVTYLSTQNIDDWSSDSSDFVSLPQPPRSKKCKRKLVNVIFHINVVHVYKHNNNLGY